MGDTLLTREEVIAKLAAHADNSLTYYQHLKFSALDTSESQAWSPVKTTLVRSLIHDGLVENMNWGRHATRYTLAENLPEWAELIRVQSQLGSSNASTT